MAEQLLAQHSRSMMGNVLGFWQHKVDSLFLVLHVGQFSPSSMQPQCFYNLHSVASPSQHLDAQLSVYYSLVPDFSLGNTIRSDYQKKRNLVPMSFLNDL